MSYTLAEAAQACGINRSTVLRAIKSGKISGQRDAQGAWTVDVPPLPHAYNLSLTSNMSLPFTHMALGHLQVPPDHCQVHGAPYHYRQRIAALAQSARLLSQRRGW
jgi:hypothetical protein